MRDLDTVLAGYLPDALRTALPTAYSLHYLAPGVYSEVGEVAGKLAKEVRDDKGEEWLGEELVYELGDVAWVTAVLRYQLNRHGVPFDREANHYSKVTLADGGELMRLVRPATRIIAAYDSWCHGPDSDLSNPSNSDIITMHNAARELWYALADVAPVTTGRSFGHVLEANVDKLLSRQDRSVLHGSGDHR